MGSPLPAPGAEDSSEEIDLAPELAPPPEASPAPAPAPEAPVDLEWESAEEERERDLPALKSVPTLPVTPVGRLLPLDTIGTALQRIDRLERAVAGLIDLLAATTQTQRDTLSKLRDSLGLPSR